MNKKLIRLTESDLHRIVKESVKRVLNENYGSLYDEIDRRLSQNTDCNAHVSRFFTNPHQQNLITIAVHVTNDIRNTKRAAIETMKEFDYEYYTSGKKPLRLKSSGEYVLMTFKRGMNEEKNIDEGIGNWIKGAAIGGMMAFSPSANAQSQNYNNNTDSVKTTTQQPQQITFKQLKKMFPQAYKDKNANPEVWKQNQKMYVAEVNGKISLVGKIAASSGQNPWDALVKKYCPSEDKTFSLSDFDI